VEESASRGKRVVFRARCPPRHWEAQDAAVKTELPNVKLVALAVTWLAKPRMTIRKDSNSFRAVSMLIEVTPGTITGSVALIFFIAFVAVTLPALAGTDTRNTADRTASVSLNQLLKTRWP
jgi:hypothetical protein